MGFPIPVRWHLYIESGPRADSRFAPSQWEMALLCNDISYWLGTSLESYVASIKHDIYYSNATWASSFLKSLVTWLFAEVFYWVYWGSLQRKHLCPPSLTVCELIDQWPVVPLAKVYNAKSVSISWWIPAKILSQNCFHGYGIQIFNTVFIPHFINLMLLFWFISLKFMLDK